MSTAPAQTQQKVTWWGWAATIGLALWAAENPTLRPVLILALIVLVLVNFTKGIKT